MTSSINLGDFINIASNPTEYRVIIKKSGNVRIKNTHSKLSKFFSPFKKKSKELSQAQFSYEVLKCMVDQLKYEKNNEDCSLTVSKACQAFYQQIEEQWLELDEPQKEQFFELPQLCSLHLLERRQVSEDQMLRILNSEYANSLGADVYRAIANEALSLNLLDRTISTPAFDDIGTLVDFCKEFCKFFHLSEKIEESLNFCLQSGNFSKFEKFFDARRRLPEVDKDEIESLERAFGLLNGLSQACVLESGGVLMKLFGSPLRPDFVSGTHDRIEIFLEHTTAEVQHRFSLAFKKSHAQKDYEKAVFYVQTSSIYDLEHKEWIRHDLKIKVSQSDLSPRGTQQVEKRLQKQGYLP
ncbi:hypothetical protein PHSC3_001620 [Chlamydiales bacterium STE3]|nr:hypothetical protein PHSC3_001620 [Chlamydiales bacterium STE3]